MKTTVTLFFTIALYLAGSAQNRSNPDSTKRPYNTGQYSTDSVKRGQEIYQGGKPGKNKSNGDTLRTRKKNMAKPNGSKNKTRTGETGAKTSKMLLFGVNEFKV